MSRDDSEWLLPGAIKDGQSITKDWQPVLKSLIAGVMVKEVRPVMTGIGQLTEVMRKEWLTGNGLVDQIFVSTIDPWGLSAWHAHSLTTDRLFAVTGRFRIVLFDSRRESPTYGQLNEFKLGQERPMLIVVPPRVWHGVQNYGSTPAVLLNAVDLAYLYDGPDHYRVAHDSPEIPYRFSRNPY